MQIRPLTEDDWGAMGLVISEAFARGEPRPVEIPDDQRGTFPLAKHLGSFDGGELVAVATILDIDVNWNGAACRMGGIAGVCCKAVARGRGHVGALMCESLVVMRDNGQPISGLYPFSQAFYRRHGWETVVARREFTMPARIIPTYIESRNVGTCVGPNALETVKPIYEEYAARYQGSSTRIDSAQPWWDRTLGSHGGLSTYVQVYVNPTTGQPEGYFTFRFPEGGKSAVLGEFAALTASAYRGLLGILHNYGTQVETIAWSAPPDDPLRLFINENELQTTVRNAMMGRVVDVCTALALLSPHIDGKAIVRIHDDRADWNDGIFEIVAEGGHVAANRSTAEPQCEMDIRTLSLACWGSHSLTALREAGRIDVVDENAFGFLDTLLPARVPYILDWF